MHPSTPRARGFSIVELLVSVAIGLLALGFAVRLAGGSEQAKSSALGSSDSMQNGMLAMFSISSDAQQAGFGMNDPLLVGCDTIFTDLEGYALAPAPRGGATVTPLAPAIIVSGGSGSDSISFYSGTALSGTGSFRLVDNYRGGTRVLIDRQPYAIAKKDVVVVAPDDSKDQCALNQVSEETKIDPVPSISVAGGSALRYAGASGLGRTFDRGTARVFNLGPEGSLSFHTWSVENGFLRLRATDVPGSAKSGTIVADNIVAIKAQYGLDKRTGAAFDPKKGLRVDEWSDTIGNPDGDTTTGGAGDYLHVAAVRIAVVARSKTPERASKPDASGKNVCTATPSKQVVFANAEPQGVTAVPVTVDLAVAGEPVDYWHCYRYRVFETIVPLRNTLWRP